MKFCTIIMTMTAVFMLSSLPVQGQWDDDFPVEGTSSSPESVPAFSAPADSFVSAESTPIAAPVDNTYTSAPEPVSYIIKKEDTLWDLANRFLSDPYLWPRIWDLNRYINNPDLIYPGNSLVIPGLTGTGTSGSMNQTFGTGRTPAEDIFKTGWKKQDDPAIVDQNRYRDQSKADSLILSSLRLKNPLSPEFYAGVPYLWDKKDADGNRYPGNGIIEKSDEKAIFHLYDLITAKLQNGATYAKGDTVDIYKSIRFVNFKGKAANLVHRAGKAVVTEIKAKRVYAVLTGMWDVIQQNDRIAAYTPFSETTIDTIIPIDGPIEAAVFTHVEDTRIPYPYQNFIIDKGSADGVEKGDIFLVFSISKDKTRAEPAMMSFTTHVNDRSATQVIFRLFSAKLAAGDRAVLIRKTRFK